MENKMCSLGGPVLPYREANTGVEQIMRDALMKWPPEVKWRDEGGMGSQAHRSREAVRHQESSLAFNHLCVLVKVAGDRAIVPGMVRPMLHSLTSNQFPCPLLPYNFSLTFFIIACYSPVSCGVCWEVLLIDRRQRLESVFYHLLIVIALVAFCLPGNPERCIWI